MKIKIFGKKDCNICKASLKKIQFFLDKWKLKDKIKIISYNLDTVDGLTEGALLNALEVPTIIIEKDGIELFRWEKKIPKSDEFRKLLME